LHDFDDGRRASQNKCCSNSPAAGYSRFHHSARDV